MREVLLDSLLSEIAEDRVEVIVGFGSRNDIEGSCGGERESKVGRQRSRATDQSRGMI